MINTIDVVVVYLSDKMLRTAITNPRVSEPLSPIKILAGFQLKIKKAIKAAINEAEREMISG